jgi:hypothetical protein
MGRSASLVRGGFFGELSCCGRVSVFAILKAAAGRKPERHAGLGLLSAKLQALSPSD